MKDDAADVRAICRFVFDQLEAGNFDAIADRMRALDVSAMSVTAMLAPLSFTVPVAERIAGRGDYYRRVHDELVQRGRADIRELLMGLE